VLNRKVILADSFTLMSYNILAASLAEEHGSYLYPYCLKQNLQWRYRKDPLVQEIQQANADIICLQEVDRWSKFVQKLGRCGYKGVFQKRTGEEYHDGCATFWKESLFELVLVRRVQYKRKLSDAVTMDRENVAVLCHLKMKSNNQHFIVANTHLLWNPKRGDLRVAQVKILFEELLSMKKAIREEVAIVICGDFNCTPDSKLYEFITKGELDITNFNVLDSRENTGYGTVYTAVSPSMASYLTQDSPKAGVMVHPFKLYSAYTHNLTDSWVSTCHKKFSGNVDYIFVSEHLQPVKVSSLPTESEVKAGALGVGLPNAHFHSDHLFLQAQLVKTKAT